MIFKFMYFFSPIFETFLKALCQKLNLSSIKFCIFEHLTENMKIITASFKKLAETMKNKN